MPVLQASRQEGSHCVFSAVGQIQPNTSVVFKEGLRNQRVYKVPEVLEEDLGAEDACEQQQGDKGVEGICDTV